MADKTWNDIEIKLDAPLVGVTELCFGPVHEVQARFTCLCDDNVVYMVRDANRAHVLHCPKCKREFGCALFVSEIKRPAR